MVRQTTSEQMSPEDFFALPGTSSAGSALLPAAAANNANDNTDKPRKGIQTSKDVGMSKKPKSAAVAVSCRSRDSLEFRLTPEDFPMLPKTLRERRLQSPAALPADHAAPPADHAAPPADHAAPPADHASPPADHVAPPANHAAPPANHAAPPADHAATTVPRNTDAYHNAEKPEKGIQTSTDGKVTNIPETMIPNQFGFAGLLTFIRAAESDPRLVSLALGQDLTTLGIEMTSSDKCCPTFAGPWADRPCRPQDLDYDVPPEYLTNRSIRHKLAPLQLARYDDDLLFYLFYCFVGDSMQIAAAAELYNRNWRYHMEEKVWIYMPAVVLMAEKTSTYGRGTYYFFDAHNWRKVVKEFHLDYSKLEGRPLLPPHMST